MQARLAVLNEEWQAEAETEGRKHIPVNIGVGLEHRPRVGRQFRLDAALHLFLPGRRREPGRRASKASARPMASASSSAARPASEVEDYATLETRPRHGEGQDRARARLCAAGRRCSCRRRPPIRRCSNGRTEFLKLYRARRLCRSAGDDRGLPGGGRCARLAPELLRDDARAARRPDRRSRRRTGREFMSPRTSEQDRRIAAIEALVCRDVGRKTQELIDASRGGLADTARGAGDGRRASG